MTSEPQAPSLPRAQAVHPRRVLFWIIVLVVVATVLYAVAPWVLPVRICEGPLVQMATEDGVTLVWYVTRPAACSATVRVKGEQRVLDAQAAGRRNVVRIEGLLPGHPYDYHIAAGHRALTDELTFQTSRSADQSYGFFVFGDSGRGTRAQYALAADMTRFQPQPDFIVHTGDLVYGDGAWRKFNERFFTPYRHLIARVNFWPCLGNHEIDEDGNAAPYEEVFELPANGPAGLRADHNYWFDYATSRFAVIDTNEYMSTERLRDTVGPWLRAVMSTPGPRWRFVVFHHPAYTGGKYAPDERVRQGLVPIIEESDIDIVFAGHDHTYQRTHPLRAGQVVAPGAGVVHIITAAGGAALYEPKGPLPAYVAVLEHEHYSFTHVTINGNELSLSQVALGGDILDTFTLQKVDASSAEHPPTQPDPARASPTGTSGSAGS